MSKFDWSSIDCENETFDDEWYKKVRDILLPKHPGKSTRTAQETLVYAHTDFGENFWGEGEAEVVRRIEDEMFESLRYAHLAARREEDRRFESLVNDIIPLYVCGRCHEKKVVIKKGRI